MKMTISNKELASSLFALALMCATEDTDNCDLVLESSKGNLICHIEFTGVPKDEVDN